MIGQDGRLELVADFSLLTFLPHAILEGNLETHEDAQESLS